MECPKYLKVGNWDGDCGYKCVSYGSAVGKIRKRRKIFSDLKSENAAARVVLCFYQFNYLQSQCYNLDNSRAENRRVKIKKYSILYVCYPLCCPLCCVYI